MSMCQQFQTYETTNVYAVPYGYEEQKWVSDQDYDLVTLMDVDASMIQTGPAVHQNVEIKNSVKLGRKYLFISLIFLNPKTFKNWIFPSCRSQILQQF